MKNVFFLPFFLLFAAAQTGFGQMQGAAKAGLSVFYNQERSVPLTGGGISLEHVFSEQFSFSAALDYVGAEALVTQFHPITQVATSRSYTTTALSFRPEARWYPRGAMHGFFAGFAVGMGIEKRGSFSGGSSITEPLQFYTESSLFVLPQPTLGLNVQITPRVCAELSGGIGLIFANDYSTAATNFGLRVGYGF